MKRFIPEKLGIPKDPNWPAGTLSVEPATLPDRGPAELEFSRPLEHSQSDPKLEKKKTQQLGGRSELHNRSKRKVLDT